MNKEEMDNIYIDKDSLKEICKATVRLTELRQNECKHLCIENYSPELFGKLLYEYLNRAKFKRGLFP